MSKSLFDLHCDTAYEMLRINQPFGENKLQVSKKAARKFDPYIQVMAFWTDKELSDFEGWQNFLRMRENLLADSSIKSEEVNVVTSCPEKKGTSLLLAIEDARIFENNLDRVNEAYRLGVRILTPLWAGETCIGGSHNTNKGLTGFGKQVIHVALELGMIPDISHASILSAKEILDLAEEAGRPCIASHSNAYEICPVSRNLNREQIERILKLQGIIGLNFHSPFLEIGKDPNRDSVLRQITYFAELGAENNLCLGCDFDGGDPPKDLVGVASLSDFYDYLISKGFSESFVNNIFFDNAYRFATRFLADEKKG